jgi:hypothetical protein
MRESWATDVEYCVLIPRTIVTTLELYKISQQEHGD